MTDDGAVLRPGQLIRTEAAFVHSFDPAQLVAAIHTDQRGESTFPEFVEQTFLLTPSHPTPERPRHD